MRNSGTWKRLVLATLATALLGSVRESAAAEREWYSLSIDQNRVGYGWHEHSVEPGHQLDSDVMRVEVLHVRKRVSIESWSEIIRRQDGEPEHIDVGSSVGGKKSGWQGAFSADARSLGVQVLGADRKQVFHVSAGLVLQDRLPDALKPLWHDGQPALEIHYLEPSAAQPVLLRAAVLAMPGEGVTHVRLAEPSGHTSREEVLWLDDEGRVIHRERDFFGATLVWDRCSANCAAPVEHPYDVMSRLIVPSPYRVPVSALAGPIRYVISTRSGRPAQMPATPDQAVVAVGPKLIVTVCTVCGPAEELTAAERARYLRPNAWVQRDAPELVSFANAWARGNTPDEVMLNLVEAVRNHMNGDVDHLGYSSALEALRTRTGDCTEYALLLAALARAKGIPARIAFGFVYSDRFSGQKDVFSPHAWVQAWTGARWQSFDAGIGQFDATHLAVRISDGSPRDADAIFMDPADLKIEELGRVR